MLVETVIAPPPAGCRQIRLTKGFFAIVDEELFDELDRYYWRAVRSFSGFYAVRRFTSRGVTHTVRMHRQIMKTPDGMVPHYLNGNTLDNRRSNLINVTDYMHRKLYSWR